ncbi:C39 family peptidase [Candidatus Woesebacteria bacterium]|nr:MAG: C39 family peptidase [Candidatus Woesebacteria bacterium]
MLKVKPFKQETGYCGPASLKIVLDYYGIEVTEKELVDSTDCSVQMGVEAGRLLEAALEYGLEGYIKDFADLTDIKNQVVDKLRPVIVDWFSEDDGHYSVVVDIDDENIYLLDPEMGHVRAMRHTKFYRVWFDFPGDYIKAKDDLTIRRMIVVYK